MPGQINRFVNYFSRSAVKARMNLGVVLGSEREGIRKFRNKELELYDKYYNGEQYDKMPKWDDSHDKAGEYIPVRKRQPRIVYNFAKVLCDRVASKLVGSDTFPSLRVENDPDTDTFIRLVIKSAKLRSKLMDTVKLMCLSGSSFLRYYIVDGTVMCETFHSNYCYPVFKPSGKLDSISIKYVFDDEAERDESGNPVKKWYRIDLTATADILYDNPKYQYESEPSFQEVSRAEHNLGFVQGEWFRTAMDKHSPDGPSLICDILDFVDELNYNISQSSMAVGYGQEPQLAISGMDVDEIDKLIKSSSKAWNLGREGKAEFIQNDLNGVKVAGELRDKVRLGIQDVARILLLDPEKMVGHAQSGEAMKVLHGPMIDLINEMRPLVEDAVIELITKIAITILTVNQQGMDTDIQIPAGYQPKSLDITAHWPPIFPMTLDDLTKKANVAIALAQSRIMSEEWATGFIANDVGVENIEEELAKIEAQPIMSPFGPIGPGGMPGDGQGQGDPTQ